MQFIHQPRAEQSAIQFSAAFTEQPLDVPIFAQPFKGSSKVNFVFAKGYHCVGHRAESFQLSFGGAPGSQDDDGGVGHGV